MPTKENFKDRLIRAFPVWRDILKRPTPFVRETIIAGGAAGAHTVSGIKIQDQLVSVIHLDFATTAEVGDDLTSEFSITANDTLLNTTTDTTGGFVKVMWLAWDRN